MKTSDTAATANLSIDSSASREMFNAMFRTDVTAVAIHQAVHQSKRLTPELELLAAVLENGIIDYQRHAAARDRQGARRFAEAEAWLWSDDGDWVFSCANCCAVLGLDADYLRRGLAQWRHRRLAAAPSRQIKTSLPHAA